MAAGDQYDKDGKLIPKTMLPSFFAPAAEGTQLGQNQRDLAQAVKEYAASGVITPEGSQLMKKAGEFNVPENTLRNLYQTERNKIVSATPPAKTDTPPIKPVTPPQIAPMGSLISRPTGSRGTPVGNSSQKESYGIATGLMARAKQNEARTEQEQRLAEDLKRARIDAFKNANKNPSVISGPLYDESQPNLVK